MLVNQTLAYVSYVAWKKTHDYISEKQIKSLTLFFTILRVFGKQNTLTHLLHVKGLERCLK